MRVYLRNTFVWVAFLFNPGISTLQIRGGCDMFHCVSELVLEYQLDADHATQATITQSFASFVSSCAKKRVLQIVCANPRHGLFYSLNPRARHRQNVYKQRVVKYFVLPLYPTTRSKSQCTEPFETILDFCAIFLLPQHPCDPE